MKDRFWRDFMIFAVMTCGGLGAFAIVVHLLMPHTRAGTPVTIVIDQRWLPPLAKSDQLPPPPLIEPSLVDAKPMARTAGLQHTQPVGELSELPAPSTPPPNPIEQAVERKVFDADVERLERRYHRSARKLVAEADDDDRPRDVCERHGMHKRIFYRHHHQSWRCVGHYRR